MIDSKEKERIGKEIIAACLKMRDMGLNQGTAGNISVRVDGGMLITPSGMPYEIMTPADIVFVSNKGEWDKDQIPSSEWRFHLTTLLDRPEFNVVVHNHALYCSTVACLNIDHIPAIHYMIGVGGGKIIPCVPYATFGTQELSDHISKGMKGYKACILKNHGLLVADKSLDRALNVAQEIEHLAHIYIQLRAAGDFTLLSDEEMDVVLEKFNHYGLNVRHKKS